MHTVLTRSDIGLIVFLVIATLTAFPAAKLAAGSTDGTAVVTGPGGSTTVSLDTPSTLVIEGREGDITFQVGDDGSLKCLESSCSEQICVRTGMVSAGRPVVCAPNGVAAMLSAGKGESLDAISR